MVNAILNHALVVTRYEGDDEPKVRKAFASELASTIEYWLVAVSDWVEVLSGTIISPRRGRPNPDYRQNVPSLRIDRATLRAEIFVPGAIYIDFTERPLVSLAQWTQATTLVAADERPPLAHVLLRDARSARRDRDGIRRAVIDAATACEVGLSDCILAGLANVVSSDEAKAMLKRRNGLMELYDFYVASVAQPATVSWGRLNGRLPGPRNLVAHEGHRRSPAETKAAIEVATALVSEVAPLGVP